MNIGVNRSIVGDDDVLFEPTSWHIKIDFIHQFILNNNVLISVLGEKGAGKTTFARMLHDKTATEFRSVMLTATPLFDALHFIEQICLQLELDVKSTFSDIVNEINARQLKTLLIIDNAEELPETFVTDILNGLKQQEGSGYCHVCILSDFTLVEMTSRLARETYHDMIHSVELQSLNEAETKAYVLMRLEAENENDKQIKLNDDLLKQFYALTNGNILAINAQMMAFFANQSHSVSPSYKRVMPYLSIIPIVALAATGVVYFTSAQTPSVSEQVATLAHNTAESIALELPLTSEVPFYEVASVHQPMTPVSLQKVDIQMANNEFDNHTDETLVVMDKVVPIPSIPHHKQVASIKTTPQKALKLTHHKKNTSLSSQTKRGSGLSQYTIQLLATRDKSEVNRLTKKYRTADGFKIRRFDNQGIVWYVLTQGDFRQREQAKAALKMLPKNLAALNPWVRATSNLKNVG